MPQTAALVSDREGGARKTLQAARPMRLHSAPSRSLTHTGERPAFQGEMIVPEWHAGTRRERRGTEAGQCL